ncbi:amino acid permease [Pseudonocardia acaciae]|uniref:amino acid permease n=1 Tax=Pseudonocardia acaciae TaxID=551276 RepID=UPI00048AEFD7|nr:amino acid permease [Pseudonocardia acaciae]
MKPALSTRQLTMIGIGGVIGAGLFVGSGKAINSTGPGVVFAYAGIGVLIVLVMRMLAELAVAAPDTGSFSAYATRELGPWAGLAVGWLYAYHWAVIVAFEAIAGAAIAQHLVPGVPTWLVALVFMAVLTGVNLAAVRSFGRFEYWFALIKVASIVAFILVGLVAIAGLLPHVPAPGASNLVGHGGLFPNGVGALLPAALTVFLSYFGTELVTVAAGESVNPADTVRRSMRSVATRIIVFYVGSIAVVVTLLPSSSAEVTASPYTAVLGHLGIPSAATVMDLIVLTAVLSCLNSGIYSSSRMVFSMATRGEAPAWLRRVNRAGVPTRAVLGSAAAGFVAVLANYFLPTDVVFTFLLNSSGAVAVVVYLCVACTQIAGRRRLGREASAALPVRMWGFPYLSIVVLVLLIGVLVGMAFTPSSRQPLILTSVATVVAVLAGLAWQRRQLGSWMAGVSRAEPDAPGAA